MAYEAPELEGFIGSLTDKPSSDDYKEAYGEAFDEMDKPNDGTLHWLQPQGPEVASKLDEKTVERRRRDYGLEGDEAYAFAERLYGIGEGDIKTEGQIEAEKELAILAKAQRGRALGYGGFDAASVLQRAGSGAQQTALTGESAIDQAARQASMAARDQLEQLLISGEQRAEDKAFALQQLAFQQEQASGSLWSNVLGGVLGAIGTVVGAVAGGPAGAMVGGRAGSAMGSGAGRYMG